MLDVAHRGASGSAPEHTFPAYDLALDLGADGLELDVHMTSDDVLVVLHDATLDRVARRPGFVADTTLRDLKAVDAGDWFGPGWRGLSIPTLDEVFRRYGRRTRYYVELKDPELYPGMEQELARLVEEHRLGGRIVAQSFSAPSLASIASSARPLPVIRLYPDGARPLIDETIEATARYAYGIGPWVGDVDRDLVRRAHEAGLAVFVYTVDAPSEMASLASLGVDGIFTNYPGRLGAFRRRLTRAGALL